MDKDYQQYLKQKIKEKEIYEKNENDILEDHYANLNRINKETTYDKIIDNYNKKFNKKTNLKKSNEKEEDFHL